MRTQCKRMYSALPSHCDRICNGRCERPCDGDASPESRVQSTEFRRTAGVGLHTVVGDSFRTTFASELFGVLDRGVASCTETRNGHCWPRPRKEAIRELVERYDEDTCRRAAKEAREIVTAQDRAPNITALFAKKCADLEAERLSRREEIRRALA